MEAFTQRCPVTVKTRDWVKSIKVQGSAGSSGASEGAAREREATGSWELSEQHDKEVSDLGERDKKT